MWAYVCGVICVWRGMYVGGECVGVCVYGRYATYIMVVYVTVCKSYWISMLQFV